MTLRLNFIPFFIIMEIIQETWKINYTFKERFFMVWPEQRINRSRFFMRSVVFGLWTSILWFLFILLIRYFLQFILFFFQFLPVDKIVFSLSLLIQTILLFCSFPKLIIKRYHDFNNIGKIYSIIYTTFLVLLTLVGIISLFMDSTVIPFVSIITLLQILSVILLLYIWLKQWTKWDNQYGPDDSNVKTWFLG